MKRLTRFISLLLLAAMLLSACGQINPNATPSENNQSTGGSDDVLYLNLTWHQHQPLYYKDDNGVYTRPWVRVHATKDYYDMAALVSNYPNVHVTINLTPVLLKQLDDFTQNGAKDYYWVLSEKDAAALTVEEKTFILERFFDANYDHMIGRFPRYQELLNKRGGADEAAIQAALQAFSEQDMRDLQVWFNLAWFDPSFLAEEPLKGLVEKGRDFSEEDKATVFSEVRRIMAGIVPLHKDLQDKGQIEVITTPYAHPILPLLIDTKLEAVGSPSAELPERFSYPQDAITHLEKSVEIYNAHFGQNPRGLWPGEGAVAQIMVPMVIASGYNWMASGEPVLAKSLGMDAFTRDTKETVQQADDLYRPYYVTNKDGEQLAVFFRDGTLSDKLGFTYSGTPGKEAAADLMQRLENIRQELKAENAEGPHIVSIILDGENAWEYYDNDGIEFLSSFYQMLSESKTIKSVTPSEYLKLFPEQRTIDDLFPGAWFSANYDTWIGEKEENTAWDYLRQTRAMLAKYDISKEKTADAQALASAQDYMYLAEGSDWFWWYGADQNSGQDSYFDIGFRELLKKVYQSLGEDVPAYIDVPIIQAAPETADQPLKGMSTPVIDGVNNPDEWASAAVYSAKTVETAAGFAYTLDKDNLYVRVDAPSGGSMARTLEQPVAVYVLAPDAAQTWAYSLGDSPKLLGSNASAAFVWTGGSVLESYSAGATGWEAGDETGQAAESAGVLEMAIPLDSIGALNSGDEVRLHVSVGENIDLLPESGPAQIIVPDLGLSTVLFTIDDPANDDFGPGTYTYPTDAVFETQVFDLKAFTAAYDDENLIFKVEFFGPVLNPWSSTNGLSVQTIDIYIDKDPGAGTGGRLLLPGRNAALSAGNGWDYALWAEGWTPQILTPQADGEEPLPITSVTMNILVDPAANAVTIRVPKDTFGDGDPTQWGFVVAVLSQDGYPAAGVWRVRDVESQAAQWRFGGAPDDSNHTRIIDLIWPGEAAQTQAEMLSGYPSSSADIGTLGVEDFAQVQEILP
jgi:alpha-amylase/alpha-mannosidase (GH57 family)